MTENHIDLKSEFNQPTKEHQEKEEIQKKHLEFSGKSCNCCVCFVYTIETAEWISDIPDSKTNVFYSTFLNSMADIIQKHNGKIVKSIGGALLFYFEDSLDDYLGTTLRCGLEMIEKRDEINSVLRNEALPTISYRVSSDCGSVLLGHSSVSATDDIFGSTVNTCSKINPLGNPNGMVIGNNFYQVAKSLHGFEFDEMEKNPSTGLKNNYRIFDVKEKSD
jgi:class 3 adenylate cyclase